MNLEDKVIVIQVLDCWLRITSIRWQVKPWNKYQQFTEFAEKKGIRNVGQMLHANRFGEFEERCAGGVYLADVWVEWLETFTDVRNQLSCYLRQVLGIMDQCKFLWAGAALIGIHVTRPFMSMLLDHKVSPRSLLVILPQLYKNLVQYPNTLCQVTSCGIPALQPYFLEPFQKETSPYGIDVCKCLSQFTENCDKELMDLYLKEVCRKLAETLKRQRGNQYGFGEDPNSSELVTKNLSETLLDDGDVTTTKPIENFFGNLDRELRKAGNKGFGKAANDLMIKESSDLIEQGRFEWRKKANRNRAQQLKLLEERFSDSQQQLFKMDVERSEVLHNKQKQNFGLHFGMQKTSWGPNYNG